MKKLIVLLAILSMIVSSCGDKRSKQEQTREDANIQDSIITVTKKQPKPIKTIAQRKEEGKEVRAELAKFKLQIPDTLLFSESTINNMSFKKYVFVVDIVDESLKKQLDTWVTKQSNDFLSFRPLYPQQTHIF